MFSVERFICTVFFSLESVFYKVTQVYPFCSKLTLITDKINGMATFDVGRALNNLMLAGDVHLS